MTQSFSYHMADLHVHTVLSPCAEIEMIPPLIVQQARRLGLTLLAVTDHNSAENVEAMVQAGAREGITVLPGMEVQTREEVHLVCLFDTVEQASEWQRRVYGRLPQWKNQEEVFGAQLIVNSEGEFVAFNDRLLLTSTALAVEDVFEVVSELGGVVIPAHVDRPTFSLIGNLGIIPRGLDIVAVEISSRTGLDEARARFPQLQGITLIQNGDAHRLGEMRNRLMLKVKRPVIEELRLAFLGQKGRRVIIS